MANKMRVRKTDDDFNNWTVANGISYTTTTEYVRKRGETSKTCVTYSTKAEAEAAFALYLEKQKFPQEPVAGAARSFQSGATRDSLQGKLSYVKALSPIVLQRYVQYLADHRLQADGSMRDFDNWKKGIPKDVYLDGLGRHFMAVWLLQQEFPAEDNHGPVTLEDSLAAIIFNASGWLHELVQERINYDTAIDHETGTETKPGYGGNINA